MVLVLLLPAVMVLVAVLGSAVIHRSRPGARAQVHVDDLVVGRVPPVCAITGVPTTNLVPVESARGGFQAWWLLLLFLGPLGIAAIAILYVLGGRTDQVSGVLPISPDAVEHYNAAVRLSRRAVLALVAVIAFGLLLLGLVDRAALGGPAIALAVVGGSAAVVWFGASIVAPSRWVDLRLDGSGRWVTVEGAHPAFAAAVLERYRSDDARIR